MWVADFHRSVSIRFQDRDFLSPLNRRASAMKFWLVISDDDLVCGSCGAILAVGISSHNLRMAIACNRCDAVNETITKQEPQKP